MSFKLGDIIVDRIVMGVAESFDGDLLYTLTQLADGTIDTSATSKDAVDKDGTLVKRFWTGKTGTFTANNAMLNLNVIGSMSGNDPEIATTDNGIKMPKIVIVKAGAQLDITGADVNSIRVNELDINGAMGKAYTKSSSASTTTFAVSGNVLTPPEPNMDEQGNPIEEQFIVKYTRTVNSGAKIANSADKFPKTIRLTLKVLAVDPCSADTLRAAYIEMPSFQPSPETSIALTTDSQLSYTGDLQVDYCSADKTLYNFYWAEEDVED